jgi:hypothetical protein
MAREAREAKAELESARASDGLAWSAPRTGRRQVSHQQVLIDEEEASHQPMQIDNERSDPTCSVPCDFTAERAAATAAATAAVAAEAAEAAEALKRQRAMPTWRAVRGKGAGKGACKIEWGTRVIIYSLLALLIPCSAIPLAIVAIVTHA